MPHDHDERRLYGDLAWTWPIISPPEDYIEETEFFSSAIKKYSSIEVETLLHLGCGGGHNDHTFKNHFQVTGVDLSERMLELARVLNPEVSYRHGDMRTVRLGGLFDAVAILDSINYMLTRDELRDAFLTAYEHLRLGGLFITHVEEQPEHFKQNHTLTTTRSRDGTELVFIENYYDPDPTDTTFEAAFVYFIRQNGKLEIHTDRHLCGIFPMETWLELLREIGFDVTQLKFEHSTVPAGENMPVLVCRK